ncbi:MAG TPA: TauD/TfdA family dioxygenase [Stellaceae bacterium]|nr:TauD/TfdA family dioxygenase [Stellaceae bacterium]
MQIRQIHPLFVGEVSGVDIRRRPDDETVAALDAAMERYAVLVFRGQEMSPEEQIQWSGAFGELDAGLNKIARAQHRLPAPELIDISNVTAAGEIAAAGSKKLASALANQLWHSDSSFQHVPGKYSMLSAVVLPGISAMGAGETEFADMRAAYDALSQGMQELIEPLVAEHYALYSRMWLGDEDWTIEQKAGMPPVRWRIVRTQPYGRKSLFIGAHANRIVGWPVPEGRMLLLDLLEHGTQRQFVYRHEWQIGDLVIWDNRSTLHRGRPYDMRLRRELRRTTTRDLVTQPEPPAAQPRFVVPEPKMEFRESDFINRRFRFGRVDGSVIGEVVLTEHGHINGYQNDNEYAWEVIAGILVFRNIDGKITTKFTNVHKSGNVCIFSGPFVLGNDEVSPWHTLIEISTNKTEDIVRELATELYSGELPTHHADIKFADFNYPHTNLKVDLVASIIGAANPKFWLEIGSMLGGSAIRTAEVVKKMKARTGIVCIDPFTGDVNMWAWEREKKISGDWQFLKLEHGIPTIYQRFLANVAASGQDDVIIPINCTSIVGIKLLKRLYDENRISGLPDVIYLDSAHEPDETFLELQNCWDILKSGGILMGDDWGWPAVRNDVTRFAATVMANRTASEALRNRHAKFTEIDGVLLDEWLWVLVKE